MYVILNRLDFVVCVSEQIHYVKTQKNGATVITEAHDATAVYSVAGNTFYRLKELTPGDELYRIVEVESAPEGIPLTALQYAKGELVVNREALSLEIRARRDDLLLKTDWTQVADAPLDEKAIEAYRQYRQVLRDIPEQPGFPYEIQWPRI